MTKKNKLIFGVISLISLTVLAWFFIQPLAPHTANTDTENVNDNAKLTVFTSILPQTYFVEQIGGDRVSVESIVTPGSSPRTYEPTPKQMADLNTADIFFSIGVSFEKALLPKITSSMPNLTIVNTRDGINLRSMKSHTHAEDKEHKHHHTAKGENELHDKQHNKVHHHTGKDPHIWMSPKLVKIQAKTIANALIEADPEGEGIYNRNLNSFIADLDALDVRMAEALAPVKGKTFMVFHPAFGYLADDYGLIQEPIEVEGKNPSGQQLARMIDLAKQQNVQVIFVQAQFDTKSAKHIAEEIEGVVMPINPLSSDYINNMDKIANTIQQGLKSQSDLK